MNNFELPKIINNILLININIEFFTNAISDGEVERDEDVELTIDLTSLSLLVVILIGISFMRSRLDNMCSINCLCISFSFSSLKYKLYYI